MDTNVRNDDMRSNNREMSPNRNTRKSPVAKAVVNSSISGRSSVATNAESVNEQDKILERENNNSSAGDARFSNAGSPMFTAEELYAVDDDDDVAEGEYHDLILNKQIYFDNSLLDDDKRESIIDANSERDSPDIKQQSTQDEDSEDFEFLNAMLHMEDVDLKKKLNALSRGPNYSRRNSSQIEGGNFRAGSNLSGSRFPSRRSSVISTVTGFSVEMSTVVTDAKLGNHPFQSV